jgi:uncharacterized protein YkuJ
MKKEEFVEIISRLQEIKKDETNLNKAFKKFEPDFNYICFGRYETIIVDTLKYAMKDTEDYIGWWLYEDVDNFVWDKKKKIDVRTPNRLYDFLIKHSIKN